MEVKQKYENAVKSIGQLIRIQKRIFNENADSIAKTRQSIETLQKIKLETEGQLQDLPQTQTTMIIRKLNRAFFITDLGAQRDYFMSEILPLKEACAGNGELGKEYERARVYVLSNSVEYFLETLSSGYEGVRQTKRFLILDKFLRGQDTNDHVKGALAIVFEKFLAALNDQLTVQTFDFKKLLDQYAEDLNYIFNEPADLREQLFGYFVNYLRSDLVESMTYKFNNKAADFLDRIEAVYIFYADTRAQFPKLVKSIEKGEKYAFLRTRDFLLDYFDKYEVVLAIDGKAEFLTGAFKAYDPKALKIWVVDLIDSYVDSSHNKDTDFFNKYTLVFRLEKVQFKALEKFLKAYLKKKLENFVKEWTATITKLDAIERTDKPVPGQADAAKFSAYYKDYFRKFLDHVSKVVVPGAKACAIKDIDFRNYFYASCITAIVAFYHKELSAFLELEVSGLEKKQCFELYANDLKEQLDEDFFGF